MRSMRTLRAGLIDFPNERISYWFKHFLRELRQSLFCMSLNAAAKDHERKVMILSMIHHTNWLHYAKQFHNVFVGCESSAHITTLPKSYDNFVRTPETANAMQTTVSVVGKLHLLFSSSNVYLINNSQV